MYDEGTKTYKITLRSTVDVEVEVAADSIDVAKAKAIEWQSSEKGMNWFERYYLTADNDHIDECFTMQWHLCGTRNVIVDAEELEGDDSACPEAASCNEEVSL